MFIVLQNELPKKLLEFNRFTTKTTLSAPKTKHSGRPKTKVPNSHQSFRTPTIQ